MQFLDLFFTEQNEALSEDNLISGDNDIWIQDKILTFLKQNKELENFKHIEDKRATLS